MDPHRSLGSRRFQWDVLQPRLPPVPPQARLTREQPADFRVEEIPAYPASGSGDHVMVTVEKTGLSTLEVARRLAQHLGVDGREVGFAGRKDVHAVAVQRFTVPRRKHVRLQPGPLSAGITILEVALHKNKLQLGHLHGNRFDILLRFPVVGALERLRERAPQVTRGVVNYFGPQRFGVDGNNVEDGIRVLTGARRGCDPRGLQLLVSAVQSHVFNLVADFRVRRDPDVLPVTGDILVKVPSGAPFHCDAPETDAARVMEGAVAVTGPLPGSRMRLPRDVPLTWESRILADVLPDPTVLTAGRRAPLGDRRAILVRPQGIQVDAVPEGIRVRLSLPPGSFATSVLREWAGILEDGAAGSAASESAG